MTAPNRRRPNAGRKTKLTPEVQEKIVSAIRAGNYAAIAAEYAGISEGTFYGWLKRGREESKGVFFEFLKAVKGAEREAEVRAVAHVQKHFAENWTAAMTFLERKFPQRWGRRDRTPVEVDPRDVLANLLGSSPDEIEEAVAEAAEVGEDG
jgi:transposase-like protein